MSAMLTSTSSNAFSGQARTHDPQEIHLNGSIRASDFLIAPIGQNPTQAWQPMQISLSSHTTPFFRRVKAPTGHISRHKPRWSQTCILYPFSVFRMRIADFSPPSFVLKCTCEHAFSHSRHPLHFSGWNLRIFTFVGLSMISLPMTTR